MTGRILLVGAGGQLGQSLLRVDAQQAASTCEIIGLRSDELDITQPDAVRAAVRHHKPTLIINAAAYTAVDKAQDQPQRAHAVNGEGPGHLGRVAQAAGIPVLHVSTDYVFAGATAIAYKEEDAVGALNVYGATKLAGEQLLRQACPRHIVLRTSWVFSEYGNNFVKTMLRLAQTHKELSIVADQTGCPTSAGNLAAILLRLAKRFHQQGELPWGLYHYSDAPACTWHAFAQEIFRQAQQLGLLEEPPLLNAITTAQYPTPAQRPLWSVLDTSKLERAFGVTQADWSVDLRRVLQVIKTDTLSGAQGQP